MVSQPLYKKTTKNKFSNTLTTKDPTNTTNQNNKPAQDIKIQQIQLPQPTTEITPSI